MLEATRIFSEAKSKEFVITLVHSSIFFIAVWFDWILFGRGHFLVEVDN